MPGHQWLPRYYSVSVLCDVATCLGAFSSARHATRRLLDQRHELLTPRDPRGLICPDTFVPLPLPCAEPEA